MNGTNVRYRHGYAVVRVDTFQVEEMPIEEFDWHSLVTVKKVVWDQGTAEQEVKRLNSLNDDKGCIYFWQITRLEALERRGAEVDAESQEATASIRSE